MAKEINIEKVSELRFTLQGENQIKKDEESGEEEEEEEEEEEGTEEKIKNEKARQYSLSSPFFLVCSRALVPCFVKTTCAFIQAFSSLVHTLYALTFTFSASYIFFTSAFWHYIL